MKIASGRQHFVKITCNKFNLNRPIKVEFRTETSLRTRVKYEFNYPVLAERSSVEEIFVKSFYAEFD